jgi:hypothetical protein
MALVIQSGYQLRSLPYGSPFLINSVIEVLRVLSDAGVSNKFISEKRSSRDRFPRKSCSIHESKNTPNRDRQSLRNWRDNGPQHPNPEGSSGTEAANSGREIKAADKDPLS